MLHEVCSIVYRDDYVKPQACIMSLIDKARAILPHGPYRQKVEVTNVRV
jgi:hypothetical protein